MRYRTTFHSPEIGPNAQLLVAPAHPAEVDESHPSLWRFEQAISVPEGIVVVWSFDDRAWTRATKENGIHTRRIIHLDAVVEEVIRRLERDGLRLAAGPESAPRLPSFLDALYAWLIEEREKDEALHREWMEVTRSQ